MDQYVIDFRTGILYWDLFDLYHLIMESGNEQLKCYAPEIKKALNEASEGTIED